MIILLYTLRSYANTFIPQLVRLSARRCYVLSQRAGEGVSLPVCVLAFARFCLRSFGWVKSSLRSVSCGRIVIVAPKQYCFVIKPLLLCSQTSTGLTANDYWFAPRISTALTSDHYCFDCVLHPLESFLLGYSWLACRHIAPSYLRARIIITIATDLVERGGKVSVQVQNSQGCCLVVCGMSEGSGDLVSWCCLLFCSVATCRLREGDRVGREE